MFLGPVDTARHVALKCQAGEVIPGSFPVKLAKTYELKSHNIIVHAALSPSLTNPGPA